MIDPARVMAIREDFESRSRPGLAEHQHVAIGILLDQVSALSHAVENQQEEIRLLRGRGVRADSDDPATALGNEDK